MAESAALRHRPWATGAAILGFVMLAVYVSLIISELGNSFWDILPWALLMAITAAIALTSVFVADRRMARNLLIGATVLFGLLGVVSILTIGLGFLLAAATAAVGASKI
jgi:hypothetical protein